MAEHELDRVSGATQAPGEANGEGTLRVAEREDHPVEVPGSGGQEAAFRNTRKKD